MKGDDLIQIFYAVSNHSCNKYQDKIWRKYICIALMSCIAKLRTIFHEVRRTSSKFGGDFLLHTENRFAITTSNFSLCGEKLKFLAKKVKKIEIVCAPTLCDKWKHARCQEKGKYGIDTSRVPDKHHLSPCNSLSGTSECFSTQRQEHKPDSRWNVHQQQCVKMENMDSMHCGCQNKTIWHLSVVCLVFQMLNWILPKQAWLWSS